MIEELKKEYETQNNRMTSFPIFVTVQERFSVGVMADGYSVNCPYGDGETVKEKYPSDDEDESTPEINVGYIWVDREWFLTIKGAEEYMKANAHNHGELRTYVHHFERRNFEMRELLKEIGFKTKN